MHHVKDINKIKTYLMILVLSFKTIQIKFMPPPVLTM